MARGKETCKILKEIRRQIAEANDIEFITSECRYKGDCLGTCPKCEAEVRYLEQQLHARRLAGKAVAIAGISAGVIMLSGCNGASSKHTAQITGDTIEVTKQASDVLEGEPPMEMADSLVDYSGIVPSDKRKSRVVTKFVPPKSDSECKEGETPAEKQEALPTQGEVTAPEDYTLVGAIEAMPQFPGGQAKLMEFLAANVKYPEAVEGSIQGRVVVLFTVKKDGSIDNIEVIRSVCHELDEEAVRVVKLFPDFIPGTINGKPVDCKYTLPIVFRLQ